LEIYKIIDYNSLNHNNPYKELCSQKNMVIRKGANLPVLYAQGESIPEAWENSIVELIGNGLSWNREGPKDEGRETLDSTMTIEISNPGSELVMHKYHECSPEALFNYQMEILGAKDSWVHPEKGSTKWPYHYHERFASYPGTEDVIDQVEAMIDGLSREPWKRRNQMITWSPERDITSLDPPCLQRFWGMIIPDEENSSHVLNVNYHFRSRNVMIAAPMNMLGMWTIQSYMRDQIIERTGLNIVNGRLVDMVDSYHVSSQDKSRLETFSILLKKSNERGEGPKERCLDNNICFGYMDKAKVVSEIINQTEKELIEKGEEYRLDAEIKKIEQISQEVSRINGY
jgi:thymidylate synthase